MSEFITLLQNQIVSTIEGLTGVAPKAELHGNIDMDNKTTLTSPIAISHVKVSGAVNTTMAVAISANLATAIGDMMLGGEGAEKEDMNEDDLDATKEIVSNILGSLSTALKAQKDMPDISFAVEDIEFKDSSSVVTFDAYSRLLIFNVNIKSSMDNISFALDDMLYLKLTGEEAPTQIKETVAKKEIEEEPVAEDTNALNNAEIRNIELIKDVSLPIRVRIGYKKMLLKDVLSMDIGSVIELDQLANDPLEILVGDKVIAIGEVVIVDGNFGIQVGEIGSKRERLEKLR
ncbi:flagellar motor switch protein FliY [Sulfurospirillum sp. 1612]|uniref:flagellar motor switch protein FliY n=1 Tax=Sulfurospirillum sp. 1612 TaxID=3094835 RepID=UPI002F92B811